MVACTILLKPKKMHEQIPFLFREGAIVQTQNCDNQIQEQNLHVANEMVEQALKKAHLFFLVRGVGINLNFLVLPSCFQMIPMIFPKFSMHSPRVFPIAPHLCTIMVSSKFSPSHLYKWAQGRECTQHFHIGTSILGNF